MRVLLLFLLATPVLADDVLLREVRAWRGEVIVESRSDPGSAGSGSEVQIEKATFTALTEPRRTMGAREKLRLQLRRTEGSWDLLIDLKEHKSGGDLATKGHGSGELNFAINGSIDVSTGLVRFKTGARPNRFVTRTTLSGVDAQGLAVFRTVATRNSFLSALDEQGELSKDRREASGKRSFVDRHGKYPRNVTVRWKLVRLDPEVRGRVLDQNDRPVPNIAVHARTWSAGRMLVHKALTDAEGKFAIPAHFATWGVQVTGREENGIVTSGVNIADATVVKFDSVPEVDARVKRYRLVRLPRYQLLATHFRGDVDRFLDYLAKRVPAARLARAEITPATN